MKQIIVALISLAFSANVLIGQREAVESSENTLTVHIQNIKSSKGTISVGVYDSSGNWLDKTCMGKTGEIIDGRATVVFEKIKNGNYGISLYHDENDNGKLDSGIFGIPTEPYACSNGAKGRFGPPKWKDAVFVIENDDAEHIIKL
jgi:uncharacterized protein (DUF2141 family)